MRDFVIIAVLSGIVIVLPFAVIFGPCLLGIGACP